MAIDDPQGIRWDCRPCLPLSRAPDRRRRRRSGIGDPFTRPEPNIQITTRLAKTPLVRGKSLV